MNLRLESESVSRRKFAQLVDGRPKKQQVFRPSVDNAICFASTVTVTIYKALWLKRLKIGVIKEQQHKKLKKRENIG